MAFKTVDRNGKEITRVILLHPGEVLADELAVRGIKKIDFAKSLGITPGNLSELLGGKRHVKAHTAIKLENLLGISAEYWLRLQMYYDYSKALLNPTP